MPNPFRPIALAAGIAALTGALAQVAPARAQPTPRADSIAAPPGDGWWCWSADVVGDEPQTGCARDQDSCVAQADDARLADVLVDRLVAVGTCRYQRRAAVVSYRQADAPVQHAAFRTVAECRRQQALLPRTTARSACAMIGQVAPAATPAAVRAAPVAAGLTKADITDAVAGAHAQVEACGAGLHGLVVVSVRVAPSGAVASATAARAFDDEVGACAAAAMQRLVFRATPSGGSFKYPFRL